MNADQLYKQYGDKAARRFAWKYRDMTDTRKWGEFALTWEDLYQDMYCFVYASCLEYSQEINSGKASEHMKQAPPGAVLTNKARKHISHWYKEWKTAWLEWIGVSNEQEASRTREGHT